jgi:hypothetical protein
MAIESLTPVAPPRGAQSPPARPPAQLGLDAAAVIPLAAPARDTSNPSPSLVQPAVCTRLRDLAKAPPVTRTGDAALVPVDIESVELRLTFTGDAHILARAVVQFEQAARGRPIIALGPQPARTVVDGRRVPYRTYVFPFEEGEPHLDEEHLIDDPDGVRHRVVDETLTPGAHTMTVEYRLDRAALDALERRASLGESNGGITFLWLLDDRGKYAPVHFSEAYVPASMEYDHHPTTIELHFPREMPARRIFSNGRVTELDGSNGEAYRIELPAHFNTSAPYLHVTDPAVVVERCATYRSIDGRDIPITIYSDRHNFESRAEVDAKHEESLAIALETMAEMEELVGPFPHESFTARIRPDNYPAMEYAGATETDVDSLRHELIHSWWGRGVFPANGEAGWIDEGLTYWYQHGRRHRLPGWLSSWVADPDGDELRAANVMQQHTNSQGWHYGYAFMIELEQLLSDRAEGLAPVMRELFAEYRHQSLTVADFRAFLSARLPEDLAPELEALFARYGAD